MKTMLVTGGAGFIGSHLTEELLRLGHRVIVVDNLSTGKRSNLPKGAEFIEGDVADAPLGGVECLFHLAAIPSVPRSLEHPLESNAVNATGTLLLLRSAARSGVRRVIYASSSSVYGDSPELPKKENQPLFPLSPYAASKLAGELYCAQAARLWNIETISLRFFNVYGPRQDPNSPYAAVLPIFFEHLGRGEALPIYGEGSQTRDFTYVGDVVRGMILASDGPGISGRVMNLAGGHPVSVLELAQRLSRTIGVSVKFDFRPARVGDILHSHADPTAAREALKFEAITSLEKGLALTAAWFEGR
jgi:UDP-glucose 4-epimerase